MVSNLNLLESRRRILLNTPHIETVSDTIASFKTDVATKLKECKIHFTPIQEGEGDPSPENVRPIHGWDGVTVTACGKNLFDGTLRSGRYVNGVWNSTNTWRTTNFIPVKSNQKYCVSFNQPRVIVSMQWNLFDKDGNWIRYTYSDIVTTTNDTAFLTFCSVRTTLLDEWKDIQLELSSEPTDYEPYTATTLTIPFPQTIYGGYVDLVKGEVVEDIATFSVDENTTPLETILRYSAFMVSYSLPQVGANENLFAWSHGLIRIRNTASQTYPTKGMACCLPYNKETIKVTLGAPDGITTKEDWDTWITENSPLQFVYRLATPNTYPIDPQTLKALRGMNNIWSDANGNIEVSFYTH